MTTSQTDRAKLLASAAIKVPVKAATTAAITLSGAQTIDGISCVSGDRVLVKNQATASENGIYNVDADVWQRASDFDGANDAVKGTLIAVTSGTVNGPSFWQVTTENPVDIGTDDITFALRNSALSGISALFQALSDDTTTAAFIATLGSSDIYSALGVSALGQSAIASTGQTEFRTAVNSAAKNKLSDVRSLKVTAASTVAGISSTLTQLALVDVGVLSNGDEIMVMGNLQTIVRSSNGGRMSYQIAQSSGIGAIFWGTTDKSQLLDADFLTSATTGHRALFGIATVRTAGSLALDLSALSAGSTSSLGGASLSAHVFPASTA